MFVMGVCAIFGAEYMRRLNNEDIARLLQIGETRGFSGMLGSIGCMHWDGKIVSLHGNVNFLEVNKPTIMLKAVASQELWI